LFRRSNIDGASPATVAEGEKNREKATSNPGKNGDRCKVERKKNSSDSIIVVSLGVATVWKIVLKRLRFFSRRRNEIAFFSQLRFLPMWFG
jgi:hypothetical protein